MESNNKRIVVIALIVLTLILGGLAVGISYYIQQNQSPTDSSAATCSQQGPSLNCMGGSVGASCTVDGAPGTCQPQSGVGIDGLSLCSCIANATPGVQCTAQGGACGLNLATCNAEGGTTLGTLDCSGSSVCCKVESGGSGSGTGSGRSPLSDCTTTCNDSDGCTCPTSPVCNAGSGANVNNGANCGGLPTQSNSCTTNGNVCLSGYATCGSAGRQSASGSCSGSGEICCAQFTTDNGGGGGSTSTKAQCGQTCNVDSDCAVPTTTGATAVCRNGVCENKSCEAGKTKPGSNCECSSLNACGQHCSTSLGLCQEGSQCGFIGAVNACVNNAGTPNLESLYCIPINPAKGYTLTQCSGISSYNLRSPLGTNVTTQAQILEACNLVATPPTTSTVVCGDGICSSSESSFTCPGDCKLPDTAIFSDRVDRIILGIVVILLGVSLAGGFDRFRKFKK